MTGEEVYAAARVLIEARASVNCRAVVVDDVALLIEIARGVGVSPVRVTPAPGLSGWWLVRHDGVDFTACLTEEDGKKMLGLLPSPEPPGIPSAPGGTSEGK